MIPSVILPAWLEGTAGMLVRLSILCLPPAIVLASAGMRSLLGRRGSGPLSLGALAMCVWLFVPWRPSLPELHLLSVYVSIFGWLWLVMGWMRLVWREGFGPIPLNGLVTLLILIGLAGLGQGLWRMIGA